MKTYNAHETERMNEVHGTALASFQSRFFAFALDFVIAFIVFTAGIIGVGRMLAKTGWVKGHVHLEFNFEHWYSLVFLVLYFGLSTYFGNGQTPGKKLLGIRVVSLAGEKLTLWQSIERALGYGASALEFGFGFVQYFIHPNNRTVHDRIAETIVVRQNKRSEHATLTEPST